MRRLGAALLRTAVLACALPHGRKSKKRRQASTAMHSSSDRQTRAVVDARLAARRVTRCFLDARLRNSSLPVGLARCGRRPALRRRFGRRRRRRRALLRRRPPAGRGEVPAVAAQVVVLDVRRLLAHPAAGGVVAFVHVVAVLALLGLARRDGRRGRAGLDRRGRPRRDRVGLARRRGPGGLVEPRRRAAAVEQARGRRQAARRNGGGRARRPRPRTRTPLTSLRRGAPSAWGLQQAPGMTRRRGAPSASRLQRVVLGVRRARRRPNHWSCRSRPGHSWFCDVSPAQACRAKFARLGLISMESQAALQARARFL